MRIMNKHNQRQSLFTTSHLIPLFTSLIFAIFPFIKRLIVIHLFAMLLVSQVSQATTSQVKTEAITSQAITKQRLSIDQMEQEFNKKFYRLLTKHVEFKGTTYSTLDELNNALEKAKNDSLYAIGLVVNNLSLLKNNYDHRDIYRYISILLDNNEMASALSLIKTIEQEADITTITHSHYLLAHFYFQRQQWQATLNYLKEDGLNLANNTYQHRQLIKGFSLQKLSQHRQAQIAYEKIPKDSQYYNAARFNIALVMLRQGGWSQANNIISKLSKDPNLNSEQALNRLYITLGYSLLKKGYYRNATSTFKQVGITSHYSNQALLGIALTAAQQDDWINALKASRILKIKKLDDLPIDEAHLLMPFFYEKSGQWSTASIGYSQASYYYQQKIETTNAYLTQPIDITRHPVKIDKRITITLKDLTLDLGVDNPKYYFEHSVKLTAYRPWIDKINNQKLNKQYTSLKRHYVELTQQMAALKLQQKRDNLNSYLDQTRYGLARLFDNNTVQK